MVHNWVVDSLFFIDIIIIFNSAYIDERDELVKDRCTIASNYLRGWFFVDLISIIPFEIFFQRGDAVNLVRFARIGRIPKIIKLLKLFRLMKL